MFLEIEKIIAFYQPIVKLSTDEYKKYEALLRYPCAENESGFCFPSKEFEKTKRTDPDQYFKYTRRMLSQIIDKLKENNGIEISLNICYLDVKTRERKEKLLEDIKNSRVGDRLVLEFTEEEELKDKNLIKQFMAEAKKYGCKFALDDFGKGYATFEPLLSFDFDYLKLDKVLIGRIRIPSEYPNQKLIVVF